MQAAKRCCLVRHSKQDFTVYDGVRSKQDCVNLFGNEEGLEDVNLLLLIVAASALRIPYVLCEANIPCCPAVSICHYSDLQTTASGVYACSTDIYKCLLWLQS